MILQIVLSTFHDARVFKVTSLQLLTVVIWVIIHVTEELCYGGIVSVNENEDGLSNSIYIYIIG